MINNTIDIKSSLYDYSVYFVDSFDTVLKEYSENITYVIDRNVYELYKPSFSGINTDLVFFMDAIESKKNMETVMEIISFWQEKHVRKNWKVLCFGGGITQDVTTIAANLFLRNIEWYFFPTTLLSMCDSCIGGKCGINFNGYKNQIGVFYPPQKIYIDTHFISTLSYEDNINGWGELLKFSLTSDPKFYEDLASEKSYIPCEAIGEYIYRGLWVKKDIIEEDEFEHDLRRVLNYGHTFGHALECYTNNKIAHGTAVIWGIDVVNYIAVKEGLIEESYYLKIKKLIKDYFLTKEIVIDDADKLFEIIKTDKKVKNNTIFLAVLCDKSKLTIYPKEIDSSFDDMFKAYLRETHEYYCN